MSHLSPSPGCKQTRTLAKTTNSWSQRTDRDGGLLLLGEPPAPQTHTVSCLCCRRAREHLLPRWQRAHLSPVFEEQQQTVEGKLLPWASRHNRALYVYTQGTLMEHCDEVTDKYVPLQLYSPYMHIHFLLQNTGKGSKHQATHHMSRLAEQFCHMLGVL